MDKPDRLPQTPDLVDKQKINAFKAKMKDVTPAERSILRRVFQQLVAKNAIELQRLEEVTDKRIKMAERAFKRAQKELEEAKEGKEVQVKKEKRRGRQYRANVKVVEGVMRETDGWESENSDED